MAAIPAYINEIQHYKPAQNITNEDIEQKVTICGKPLAKGFLESSVGCQNRRFASAEEQVSDLAVKAVLQLDLEWRDVDLLIFAAASSDLMEPATANIIQYKLGLRCPAFDIKNACNSVTNAIHIANGFIQSGFYQKILIVNGEKLSEVIRYSIASKAQAYPNLPAYSLGDAGTALLISKHNTGGRLVFEYMYTNGKHWPLCTVRGGGSMALHDMDAYYFEGDANKLKESFTTEAAPQMNVAMHRAKLKDSDIDVLITHQVTAKTTEQIAKNINVSLDKSVQIFEQMGNIAAATIPATLAHAVDHNLIKKGSRVLIIGLAAGINLSFQYIKW